MTEGRPESGTISLVQEAHAGTAECAVGAIPIVGESLQLAWTQWARLWGAFMCVLGTVKSSVETVAGWWNKNADNLNKSMDNIRATKEAMDAVKSIDVRVAEQRDQIRRIAANLVVNDKDWTKIRLGKIRPETLILLRDLESFNGQVEALTGHLAANEKMSVPEWRNTRKGVAFENAVKARNDYMLEQAKNQALQEEFSSAERAATHAGKKEDGPSTLETYERLSLPTVHKVLMAQHQAQLLQLEILIKIYEAQTLERPIDRNPMGRSSSAYFTQRLSELKGATR